METEFLMYLLAEGVIALATLELMRHSERPRVWLALGMSLLVVVWSVTEGSRWWISSSPDFVPRTIAKFRVVGCVLMSAFVFVAGLRVISFRE